MMGTGSRPIGPAIARPSGHILASDTLVLLGLGLAWLCLWLLTRPAGNFPLNDDWVYALSVRSILDTGRFTLPSPSTANVFAQSYWGALFCLPFGFSFDALRVSTFVLGTAGILATFLLLRELGLSRGFAALGALTLAANPIYLQLSTTFMTDVPFTALVAISLWLYVRGVGRDSKWSLTGAFVVAFIAIMVRQFGIMLPLAFGVAHVTRRGVTIRSVLIAVLPIVAAGAMQVGYQHWLVVTDRTPVIVSPMSSLIPADKMRFLSLVRQMSIRIMLYCGLFLTPFVLAMMVSVRSLSGISSSRYRWVATLALSIVVLLLLQMHGEALPMLGNILTPIGLGPLTLTDTFLAGRNLPEPSLLLQVLWPAATLWSTLVACYVAVELLATGIAAFGSMSSAARRAENWPLMLFLTVSGAYIAGLYLIGYQSNWFDRYLIVLIPPLLSLLAIGAKSVTTPRLAAAATAIALYALFSLASTHDYLAWNRARWAALDDLTKQGVSPREIDGGYEFNGWLLNDPNYQQLSGKSYWWVIDDKWMIASGPMPGYHQVAHHFYRRWLAAGQQGDVVTLHR